MPLLKIYLPNAYELTQRDQEASFQLKQIFLPMDYSEGQRLREEINFRLSKLSTSGFFRLMFPALTDLIKLDDGVNKFYDASGSFKLHQFLREQLKVNARLLEIKKELGRIGSRSYIRLSDAFKDEAKFLEEGEPLKWCSSFLMLDFIVEIVLVLEEMEMVSTAAREAIQLDLCEKPSLFIRKLSPLLCAAQSIALEQKGAFSLSAVERTVDEALGYLRCSGERETLISQVKGRLFDKGCLELPEEASLEVVADVFQVANTLP